MYNLLIYSEKTTRDNLKPGDKSLIVYFRKQIQEYQRIVVLYFEQHGWILQIVFIRYSFCERNYYLISYCERLVK